MKLWLCVCSVALLSKTPEAQYYYSNDRYYESAVALELGGSFGIMNCLTDLGGRKGIGKGFLKDLNWKNTKASYTLYASAMYQYNIGLRLEITFGSVHGADSILKPVAASTYGRYDRNLSFKSRITDIQFAFEIHPLFFRSYEEDKFPISLPMQLRALVCFHLIRRHTSTGNGIPFNHYAQKVRVSASIPTGCNTSLRSSIFQLESGSGTR